MYPRSPYLRSSGIFSITIGKELEHPDYKQGTIRRLTILFLCFPYRSLGVLVMPVLFDPDTSPLAIQGMIDAIQGEVLK